MDISYLLTKEAQEQGLELHEPDDHILELKQDGAVIARISQQGIKVCPVPFKSPEWRN